MKKQPNPDYNEVQILNPKPNKMFPDWMSQRVRFMRFQKYVPCTHCGKRSRLHWTMLMTFQVAEPRQFTLVNSERVFMPMVPVCTSHLLDPCMPFLEPEPKRKAKVKK